MKILLASHSDDMNSRSTEIQWTPDGFQILRTTTGRSTRPGGFKVQRISAPDVAHNEEGCMTELTAILTPSTLGWAVRFDKIRGTSN
jgi:hypothetical protein